MDSDFLFKFQELFEDNATKPEPSNLKRINLDMWGGKRSKDHKKIMYVNKFLKPFRLAITKLILETMNSINVDIMIYGGTALAVWRDNGTIIPHDHDIDLALLEKDFLKAYKSLNEKHEIVAEAKCPFTGRWWFNENETDQILYDNVGVKRMKVYFKETYMKKMAETDKQFAKLWSRYDRNKLNIDIFALQRKPGTDLFRVTWNLPNIYDNDKKCFPIDTILPLKEYELEGLSVMGPRDLYNYLRIEYGYLEKDARYDHETQLYVKLTESQKKILPAIIRRYMKC